MSGSHLKGKMVGLLRKKKKKGHGAVLQRKLHASECYTVLFKVKGHNNKLYLESMYVIEGHRNVLTYRTGRRCTACVRRPSFGAEDE